MSDTDYTVRPSDAQWYYVAEIDLFGETDYIDGYASGDAPTLNGFQESRRCRHAWVAGMMYVDDEDVEAVNAVRPVECEACGRSYAERDKLPLSVLGWTVTPIGTPAGAEATA